MAHLPTRVQTRGSVQTTDPRFKAHLSTRHQIHPSFATWDQNQGLSAHYRPDTWDICSQDTRSMTNLYITAQIYASMADMADTSTTASRTWHISQLQSYCPLKNRYIAPRLTTDKIFMTHLSIITQIHPSDTRESRTMAHLHPNVLAYQTSKDQICSSSSHWA